MLPYFVGYQGSNIAASSQVNAVHAVQKIAQQIAQELQQPSQIPEKATLAKFTILARLVRIMDAKQIEQAARELYAPASKSASQSQSASAKNAAWKVFRDNIPVLIDAARLDPAGVAELARSVSGVSDVHRVRSRGMKRA